MRFQLEWGCLGSTCTKMARTWAATWCLPMSRSLSPPNTSEPLWQPTPQRNGSVCFGIRLPAHLPVEHTFIVMDQDLSWSVARAIVGQIGAFRLWPYRPTNESYAAKKTGRAGFWASTSTRARLARLGVTDVTRTASGPIFSRLDLDRIADQYNMAKMAERVTVPAPTPG